MKSCGQIQELLGDFLSGRLDAEIRDEVLLHLDACPDCKELVSILSGDSDAADVAAPPGLAASVLERTTGRVCSEAALSLPESVDGELGELEGKLVSLHLDGCGDCRSLERALRRMSEMLPILAEAEPGPGFARRVIDATSERVSRWEDLSRAWRGLVRRPRFAFEVSYVAVVALVFVLGLNGTGEVGRTAARFMAEAPSRAALAPAEIAEEAAEKTVALTGVIADRVASGARQGVASGRTLIEKPTESLMDRAGGVSEWLKERWHGLSRRIEKQKIESDKNKESEK